MPSMLPQGQAWSAGTCVLCQVPLSQPCAYNQTRPRAPKCSTAWPHPSCQTPERESVPSHGGTALRSVLSQAAQGKSWEQDGWAQKRALTAEAQAMQGPHIRLLPP